LTDLLDNKLGREERLEILSQRITGVEKFPLRDKMLKKEWEKYKESENFKQKVEEIVNARIEETLDSRIEEAVT